MGLVLGNRPPFFYESNNYSSDDTAKANLRFVLIYMSDEKYT